VADLSELPLSVRLLVATYRWRRVDPVPWTPLGKPLAAARVALVTSAGLVAPGDAPFDEEVRGGDWSHRWIAADTPLAALGESHRSHSWDHSGVAADRNLALPLDRLRELAATGRVGEVAPRHVSIMGSITAPARLLARSAPAIVEGLLADRVDAAALVPV
jgi:D-proline reductase (dithiol) PrdB